MTIYQLDTLVENVQDYFQANFETKADAINARFGDKIQIENIKEWRWDDPLSYSGQVSRFPVCNIFMSSMTIGQWGSDYEWQTPQLVIWLTAQARESETLRRQLYRYTLAITELLKDGHLASTTPWRMPREMRVDFSPLLTRNNIISGDMRVLTQLEAMERAS